MPHLASQDRGFPSRGAELLSPAGDRTCIRAAIENGADAVYFGLECGFNARARATNLHLDDLPEIMAELHARGVRGYVTLNTLVFSEELAAIERTVIELTEAGVDAVLVQDLGLARLIRAVSPDLPIHASTQMTLTSAECIRMAEVLGIERVVLARELSIDEIRRIRAATRIDLEAFVHGALCVAYSGQCLTSESLGGRSANRGQCAQACRLPYDLVCEGRDVDLDDIKYLLSPQDLAAYALVPELIDAGIGCLKIEGRLKTPEYVANITRHYRRAIDAAMAGRTAEFSANDVAEMEMSFSRGFSPGWLRGCDHKMLVPGLSSAKRGVPLGTVRQVSGKGVVIAATGALAPGDGIVFAGDRLRGEEQGGRIYEVIPHRDAIELRFRHGSIDFTRLYAGQRIWKTDDPKLTARLRRTYTGDAPQRRLAIDLEVEASVGKALAVTATAENGAQAVLLSAEALASATKHPLSLETLQAQFGRLGGTEFELRDVVARINGGPMVPLSVLGKLRHEMIEALRRASQVRPARRIRSPSEGGLLKTWKRDESTAPPPAPKLHVLCRSIGQLEEVLVSGIKSVMADFADIREYRTAVQLAGAAGAELFLATPRIQKPGEMPIFRSMAKQGATGFLVRNLAGVGYSRDAGIPFVCDFSLNAANPWTVDALHTMGAGRITASYDLNREQLLELVDGVPPHWLEVVIHQHMPMFHMEHCVFCAVLSPGTNKTNCGRPCDVHAVKLRDRVGMEHPLHADVGCRNTLFNAVAQSAAEVVPQLLAAGIRDFRVELLDERGVELRSTLELYRELLAGRVTGKQVWQRLRAANRFGVTRGTLEERRNPLAII